MALGGAEGQMPWLTLGSLNYLADARGKAGSGSNHGVVQTQQLIINDP